MVILPEPEHLAWAFAGFLAGVGFNEFVQTAIVPWLARRFLAQQRRQSGR